MRKFILIVLVVAALVAAAAAYLIVTTPKRGATLRFPLDGAHRALLAHVPADAEAFAVIPTVGMLEAKLRANPVTREAIERWEEQRQLPEPWILGGADAVVWKSGKTTSYAVRVDAFRAVLMRIYLMFSALDTRWAGRVLIINSGDASPPISEAELAPLLALAERLPESDAFVVQREESRGMFPPIGRPAVTSVRMTEKEIVVFSRARSTEAVESAAVAAKFARGALLSATFARPPRILDDLRRVLRTNVSALVDRGGAVALYGVDTGTLLPKPSGVIVIPRGGGNEAAMKELVDVAELIGETRQTPTELLVSFDRRSIGQYSNDVFVPATWPTTRWAVRIDPGRMVPILERVGDSAGLRIASPRLYRAARDLRRWIRSLSHAEAIEAGDSVGGGFEELRVRIASK